MLGKLIKFEFRAVTKTLLLINSFTVMLTVIGCLTFVSPMWEIPSEYTFFLAFSSVMVYYLAVLAISIFTVVYLGVRFYRNLYTDEGYLMHTLPVTPRELILSKLFTAVCWSLITTLCIVFSLIALLGSAYLKFGVEELGDVHELFANLSELTMGVYSMTLSGTCVYVLISLVVGSFQAILMIYAAISLGQLFQKHKILGAVLSYVGFYFATQILEMIFMIPKYISFFSMDFLYADMGSFMRYEMNAGIIISLIGAGAYYFISEMMMRKKLNLD